MERSTQYVERLKGAVSFTVFWLVALLIIGSAAPSVARLGIVGTGGTALVHNQTNLHWVESCVALAADDQEDITAPGQYVVEAADGIGQVDTGRLRSSSHRLALGLLTYPVFSDRPEAGARHARAPPTLPVA